MHEHTYTIWVRGGYMYMRVYQLSTQHMGHIVYHMWDTIWSVLYIAMVPHTQIGESTNQRINESTNH